jgi:hypothetical protein
MMIMKMKVEYSSNNSGGSWWLSDEDWYALEKGGWKVGWASKWEEPWRSRDPDGRYLGALARGAEIEVHSLEEAKESFQLITGQWPEEEGCECCGPPHNFYSFEHD